MRIISLDQTPVEKELTCKTCGCHFAYVPKDVQAKDHVDMGGGHETWYAVTCPNTSCGRLHEVTRPK